MSAQVTFAAAPVVGMPAMGQADTQEPVAAPQVPLLQGLVTPVRGLGLNPLLQAYTQDAPLSVPAQPFVTLAIVFVTAGGTEAQAPCGTQDPDVVHAEDETVALHLAVGLPTVPIGQVPVHMPVLPTAPAMQPGCHWTV